MIRTRSNINIDIHYLHILLMNNLFFRAHLYSNPGSIQSSSAGYEFYLLACVTDERLNKLRCIWLVIFTNRASLVGH